MATRNEVVSVVKGTQDVIKRLNKFGEIGIEAIKANVEASAYIMQAEAIRRVPVDLGQLKNSIKAEVKPDGLSASVFATAPYAPFQEFGTGGTVSVPPGMEEIASQSKGSGLRRVNLPPQPFLFPAWYNEQKAFVIRLNKELEIIAKNNNKGIFSKIKNWFSR